MSFFRILDYLPTCHHSSSLRPVFTVFGTKDNWHSENGQKTRTRGSGQKQSQGNLKTDKLTEKQSDGTSHCILKTAKEVVMGKLKTGKMFEQLSINWFFFETQVLHCCEKKSEKHLFLGFFVV